MILQNPDEPDDRQTRRARVRILLTSASDTALRPGVFAVDGTRVNSYDYATEGFSRDRSGNCYRSDHDCQLLSPTEDHRGNATIQGTFRQRYGISALTQTAADLPVLQRLIDDRAFKKRQTFELQSLGIAFGDVLSSELPLRWVIVTDEYGTDPTLRFKNTTLQINALTMISKRIERDEMVNLDQLLQTTREQLGRWSQKGTL